VKYINVIEYSRIKIVYTVHVYSDVTCHDINNLRGYYQCTTVTR